MPSVTNEKVKKKFFSFDLLLLSKNQKVNAESNVKKKVTSDSGKKKRLDSVGTNSSMNNENMFLEDLGKIRFNRMSSKTIQSGYLRNKTNRHDRKSNNFFRLRQYGDLNCKILLECYKDESLKKVKFIIDLDNVEQIDLNENLNTIYLSKSDLRKSEECILQAGDKTSTSLWLNSICKHCGFNEIKNERKLSLPNVPINHKNERQHIPVVKTRLIPEAHLSNKSKNTNQSREALPYLNKKIIAGVAASSVGSYDLCNDHLEKIFRNKSSPTNGHKLKESINLDAHTNHNGNALQKESYIDLQECLSGVDPEPPTRSKSSEKLMQSRSYDMLPRKSDYDENYSLFDFDINTNQAHGNEKTASNIINQSKIQASGLNITNKLHSSSNNRYYQDNYDNLVVSRGYYNQSRNPIHNDYINYTETFDTAYGEPDSYQDSQHVGLRYVPLEVIENKPIYPAAEFSNSKKYTKDMNNSLYGDRFHNRNNKGPEIDNGKMYTYWDAMRTQALKHTKFEFQRASS